VPIGLDVMQSTARSGIVCLTGLSSGGRRLTLDAGLPNRVLVLENDVVFGSVNANHCHREQAAGAPARADRAGLRAPVRRRVPLARWPEALERRGDDVEVVLEFAGARGTGGAAQP